MHTIVSCEHCLHNPPFEILDGQITPYFELPRRVEIILGALDAAGFPAPQPPRSFGLAPVLAVHNPDYVDYLERAYRDWLAAGKPAEAVLPCTMPLGGMQARSSSPAGEAGRYLFDLSAPIVAGTYQAARVSADTALTAADLLLDGARAAYALCRPPGHHAMPGLAGGYCYLNNAAIAAHYLATSDLRPPAAGHDPVAPAQAIDQRPDWVMRPPVVAVLDIDFHHGNGTQAIFYQRSDVFFASLHGDPDREYPYFAGYSDERGAGPGAGYNLNLPLAAGIDDRGFLAALELALAQIAAYHPRYLVISAGFDTFGGDPLGDFALTTACYGLIGARIAKLGLPTLFIQEGGYAIDDLGLNLVALLSGFNSA